MGGRDKKRWMKLPTMKEESNEIYVIEYDDTDIDEKEVVEAIVDTSKGIYQIHDFVEVNQIDVVCLLMENMNNWK